MGNSLGLKSPTVRLQTFAPLDTRVLISPATRRISLPRRPRAISLTRAWSRGGPSASVRSWVKGSVSSRPPHTGAGRGDASTVQSKASTGGPAIGGGTPGDSPRAPVGAGGPVGQRPHSPEAFGAPLARGVLQDPDLLHRHQALGHHLVQHREEPFHLLRCVDELHQDGQVLA